MRIQNTEKISQTQERKDALEIAEAGLAAIDAKESITQNVQIDGSILRIKEHTFNLTKYKRIYLAGIGKMACDASSAIIDILGEHIHDGMILGSKEINLTNLECVVASHPLPTQKNVDATIKLVEEISQTNDDDLILVIVSGGGSSMMCYPSDMSCDEESIIVQQLFSKGATIQELNTVRKHLSKVKGGWLAYYAGKTDMIALIFSDVPNEDLSMVASGPTMYDHTTILDAQKILADYNVLAECDLPSCNLLETPKDQRIFENVTNILMVDGVIALKAMENKAQELGYTTEILTDFIEGEARTIHTQFLPLLKKGHVVLANGESTVTLKNNEGRGGRNQEAVVGATQSITDGQLFISLASDGKDFTSLAGGIADNYTKTKANEMNLKPLEYLDDNNPAPFLIQAESDIYTGILESNVADLYIAMQSKR